MTSYERQNIRQLDSYVPGEQPETDGVIKLNTNENPYPPAEAVLSAIASVGGLLLRRYPPADAAAFRQIAAKVHGVSADHIMATNGGDELLRLAISVFCEPAGSRGDGGTVGGIGMGTPSYSLMKVLAAVHDTPLATIPLDEDFALPENFADRLNDEHCRLAVVVNPHAPSGRLESLQTLEDIARRFNGVVLIDEAYVDFADCDALGLLGSDRGLDNVLLLRTLSKGYSLAGLRFGYGIGHPDLIGVLNKARDSFNTDIIAQRAAMAALDNREEAHGTWKKVISQRELLSEELCERGYRVLPSESNFLLARPPLDGPEARTLYLRLKERKIFVRYFQDPMLSDKLRITVGTPSECKALLEVLDGARRQA